MSFTKILNMYLNTLETIEYKYHRNVINAATRACLLAQNRDWYQTMCTQDGIQRYTIRYGRDITEEEHQKYDLPNMSVDELIIYRDNIIPCYEDDAGQQQVALIRNEYYGGGAYNFNYMDSFCDILDSYLEEELVEEINQHYSEQSR